MVVGAVAATVVAAGTAVVTAVVGTAPVATVVRAEVSAGMAVVRAPASAGTTAVRALVSGTEGMAGREGRPKPVSSLTAWVAAKVAAIAMMDLMVALKFVFVKSYFILLYLVNNFAENLRTFPN